MDVSQNLKRRAVLVAAGGLGLGSVMAGGVQEAAASVAEPPEAAWPAQITAAPLDVCLKIRMSTGPNLRAGCLMGRYYGVVDNEMTHLFDLLSGAFYLARRRPDGGFDTRYFEAAFFIDPVTGEPLDEWVNPYTRQTVKVPMTRLGPAGSVLGKDLRVTPKMMFPGATLDDRFLAPVVLGDNVWLTERVTGVIPASAMGPRLVYNETTTALARLSDVNDASLTQVPATTSSVITVNWRPWMRMGSRPGNMMTVGAGVVVDKVEDLPARYLALGDKYYPDFFTDPATFMMKGWA